MHDEKKKQTKDKPKLHLVPAQIVRDIAVIREYGNNKYPEGGPDNWKDVDIEFYYDAAYRHLLLELENPGGNDAESGLPHLSHLACNVAFLCEMQMQIKKRRESIQAFLDAPTRIPRVMDQQMDPAYYFHAPEGAK